MMNGHVSRKEMRKAILEEINKALTDANFEVTSWEDKKTGKPVWSVNNKDRKHGGFRSSVVPAVTLNLTEALSGDYPAKDTLDRIEETIDALDEQIALANDAKDRLSAVYNRIRENTVRPTAPATPAPVPATASVNPDLAAMIANAVAAALAAHLAPKG